MSFFCMGEKKEQKQHIRSKENFCFANRIANGRKKGDGEKVSRPRTSITIWMNVSEGGEEKLLQKSSLTVKLGAGIQSAQIGGKCVEPFENHLENP